MKRCHDCGYLAPDGAAFCGTCSSSFSAKFCPRLHMNPVDVKYCLICGSEELSRPHRRPRSDGRLIVFFWLVLISLVAVLIAYSIAASIINSKPGVGVVPGQVESITCSKQSHWL